MSTHFNIENEEELGKVIVRTSYKETKYFNASQALAFLIYKNIVFANSSHWNDELPESQKDNFSMAVNCNDTFIPAADAEGLNYKELEDLYDHVKKDPVYGADVWVMKKRGMLPMKGIYDTIQRQGIWDLDEMDLEDNYQWSKTRDF